MDVRLEQADCIDFLSSFRPGSVDLVITSPPYGMKIKPYEKDNPLDLHEYLDWQTKVIQKAAMACSDTGSICWQVGNHIASDGAVIPLDCVLFERFLLQELYPRNRIVWTFEHGLHCKNRFSGRHETILWFAKSKNYIFNLDAVRIPQKYPNKKYYKGPKQGQISSNPLGKNPTDSWKFQKEFFKLPIFPVKEHRATVSVEEFINAVNLASHVICEMKNTAMFNWNNFIQSNPTMEGKLASDIIQNLSSSTNTEPNFSFLFNQSYATIAIKKTANEISVEVGRNRWVIACEALTGNNAIFSQVFSHSFAISTNRITAPFFVLINWSGSFELGFDIINQFNIFRSKFNSITFVTDANIPVTDHQTKSICTMTSKNREIILFESVLAITFDISRTVTKNPFVMSVAQSLTTDIANTSFDRALLGNNIFSTSTNFHYLPPIFDIQFIYNKTNGNPPWDVWEIPNVKHNHVEKTEHPCQFPAELCSRLILALTNENGLVVDPFMGSGTAGVAAAMNNRRFAGCDNKPEYVEIARNRLEKLERGALSVRQPQMDQDG